MGQFVPIETTIEIIGLGENLGDIDSVYFGRKPIYAARRAIRTYIDIKITVKCGEQSVVAETTLNLSCPQFDQLIADVDKARGLLRKGEQNEQTGCTQGNCCGGSGCACATSQGDG